MYYKLGGLNSSTLFSHSSGGWSPGVSAMLASFEDHEGKIYARTLSLAYNDYPLAASSHGCALCVSNPGVSLCVQISSFYEGTRQVGLGPNLKASF